MKNDHKSTNQYDDIINLPHHVSSHRKVMSLRDRAAQFSPFAAVAGYDIAIKETSRLTDQKVDLDETAKIVLNEKIKIIQEQLNNQPVIEIIFFQPDNTKSGGSYVSIIGPVKKIETYESTFIMQDDTQIPITDIIDIKGNIFQVMDDFFA